jgi:hypothetical protein
MRYRYVLKSVKRTPVPPSPIFLFLKKVCYSILDIGDSSMIYRIIDLLAFLFGLNNPGTSNDS